MPRKIGKDYDIIRKIGEGAMGKVYLARQRSLDREVAVKILSEKYSSDKDYVKGFVVEARAAGKFNHPNIIHVYDVGKTGELYYFSMEYVDGESLRDLIKREGKLEPANALQITSQICEGLKEARNEGITHRDIKPANIMMTKTGIAKLADLGLSQPIQDPDEAAQADTENRSKKVMGTPHYMSPEQAKADHVGHESDIYSLGATLFHMLTGEPPFSGDSSRELMKKHVVEPPPAPSALVPGLSRDVDKMVLKMLEKNPKDRFQSAAEVNEKIASLLKKKNLRKRNAVSTAQRTVKRSPSEFKRDRSKSNSPFPLLILVAIPLAIVIFLVMQPSRNSTGSHNNRYIAQAKDLEKAGKFLDALDVLQKAGSSGNSEIKHLKKQIEIKYIDNECTKAMSEYQSGSLDITGAITRLRNLNSLFMSSDNSEASTIIQAFLRRLQKEKNKLETDRKEGEKQKKIDAAKAQFAETKQKAGEFCRKKQFDAARNVCTAFIENHPDAAQLVDFRSAIQYVDHEEHMALEDIKKRKDFLIKRGQLEKAVSFLDITAKTFGSKTGKIRITSWSDEIKQEKKAKQNKLTREFFEKLPQVDKTIALLLSVYDYNAAGDRIQKLETDYGKFAEKNELLARKKLVESSKKYFANVKDRIRDRKQPAVEASFIDKGIIGHITDIDDEYFTITSKGFETRLPLTKYPAGLVKIARYKIAHSSGRDFFDTALFAYSRKEFLEAWDCSRIAQVKGMKPDKADRILLKLIQEKSKPIIDKIISETLDKYEIHLERNISYNVRAGIEKLKDRFAGTPSFKEAESRIDRMLRGETPEGVDIEDEPDDNAQEDNTQGLEPDEKGFQIEPLGLGWENKDEAWIGTGRGDTLKGTLTQNNNFKISFYMQKTESGRFSMMLYSDRAGGKRYEIRWFSRKIIQVLDYYNIRNSDEDTPRPTKLYSKTFDRHKQMHHYNVIVKDGNLIMYCDNRKLFSIEIEVKDSLNFFFTFSDTDVKMAKIKVEYQE